MSDLDIHNFQDGSFPKMGAIMDTDNHPDRHTIETEHRHGTALESSTEKPQPTDTGMAKKVKYPFKGANS